MHLLLNISKPRTKFRMIFAQNDWVNNHFTKMPITEHQKKSFEEVVSKFTPLQEAIENIPPALP